LLSDGAGVLLVDFERSHVHVNERGPNVGVPHESHEGWQADAAAQHIGGIVTQGMDRGAWKVGSTRESDLLGDVVECGFGIVQKQRPSSQGNEHVIVQRRKGTPSLEVLFQAGMRSLVKGNELALRNLEQRTTRPSPVMS